MPDSPLPRTPAVSIGMPVYNGEKYIRAAIDSLLGQSFVDFELILSDNASDDGTAAICKQYVRADRRVRYIRQSENIGVIPNYRFVLGQGSGRFFMWAASDDVWDTRWLEKLVEVMEQSRVGAAFGRVRPINENAELIAHVATKASYRFRGSRTMRRLRFYCQFEGAGKANLFYALFRRGELDTIDLRPNQADYVVIYDLLGKTEIESVADVFLYKRDHSHSAGNRLIAGGNLLSTLHRAVLPIPPRLIAQYCRHSSLREKVAIILLYPYKLMVAYVNRVRRLRWLSADQK